jgi:hypothetical protein
MKKEALLRELAKLTADTVLRPDEITCQDYLRECRKLNPSITMNSARYKLAQLKSDGTLKSRKVIIDGKECNAYSAK